LIIVFNMKKIIFLSLLSVLIISIFLQKDLKVKGTILYPSFGGTGTSTKPSYGQLLVGNSKGTYDLKATSTLGIIPSLQKGSILFSNGSGIAEDNDNLYYDDTNDRLFLGDSHQTVSGWERVVVSDSSGGYKSDFIFTIAGNTGGYPIMGLGKQRGTYAAPSNVLNGDRLGSYLFFGYDNGWQAPAGISAFVDGALGTYIPTKLSFYTSTPTQQGVERLTIKPNGYVGVNNNNPTSPLVVKYPSPNSSVTQPIISMENDGTQSGFSFVFSGNLQSQIRADAYGNMVFASKGTQYFGYVSDFNIGVNIQFGGTAWSPKMFLSSNGGLALGYDTTDVGAGNFAVAGKVGIGTNSPNEKLEVNGGVRLNTTTAKPTCDASHRGTLWFTQGAAGVKDTLEVCAKDASDTYSWRTLY